MTEFDEVWARHYAGLQEALDRAGDTTPLSYIEHLIREDAAQFWAWGDSAMVTQVRDNVIDGTRHGVIWLATGSLETLEANLSAVEDFFRASGCRYVEINGRPGWTRSFLTRRAGYRPATVAFFKEL